MWPEAIHRELVAAKRPPGRLRARRRPQAPDRAAARPTEDARGRAAAPRRRASASPPAPGSAARARAAHAVERRRQLSTARHGARLPLPAGDARHHARRAGRVQSVAGADGRRRCAPCSRRWARSCIAPTAAEEMRRRSTRPLRLAYNSYASVAVLISQRVIGIKSFQEQAAIARNGAKSSSRCWRTGRAARRRGARLDRLGHHRGGGLAAHLPDVGRDGPGGDDGPRPRARAAQAAACW